MSRCLAFAPFIGARPGELTALEEEALREHLATCGSCQARLADEKATSGLIEGALLAAASERDFTNFSDEVLARIPAYARRRGRGGFFAFARRHRLALATSALGSALVALGLLVYLSARAPEPPALVEVDTEGQSPIVLETSDGPVVLLGDEGHEGS
ncbi:MAG TPA: zf-HC2 domain-containing protein [Anaeromyxobacteraceae bacterium]|nr:zf-HC2 domain-containing protein [Anaeromyxobacteraceae bacterium]